MLIRDVMLRHHHHLWNYQLYLSDYEICISRIAKYVFLRFCDIHFSVSVNCISLRFENSFWRAAACKISGWQHHTLSWWHLTRPGGSHLASGARLMQRTALQCTETHFDALLCTMMHNATHCTQMHRIALAAAVWCIIIRFKSNALQQQKRLWHNVNAHSVNWIVAAWPSYMEHSSNEEETVAIIMTISYQQLGTRKKYFCPVLHYLVVAIIMTITRRHQCSIFLFVFVNIYLYLHLFNNAL